MSQGKKICLHDAQLIAKYMEEDLGPVCLRVQVVGSVRRQCQEVGDVDIVVVPNGSGFVKHMWDGWGKRVAGVTGEQIHVSRSGVRVEIYVASEIDFVTQMAMWTGSKEENIRMRAAAKKMDFKLNQYGLTMQNGNGTMLHPQSEVELYNLIGMRFKQPEER